MKVRLTVLVSELRPSELVTCVGQNARIKLMGKKEQHHTSLGALDDRLILS
jgi:hypothetical protein